MSKRTRLAFLVLMSGLSFSLTLLPNVSHAEVTKSNGAEEDTSNLSPEEKRVIIEHRAEKARQEAEEKRIAAELKAKTEADAKELEDFKQCVLDRPVTLVPEQGWRECIQHRIDHPALEGSLTELVEATEAVLKESGLTPEQKTAFLKEFRLNLEQVSIGVDSLPSFSARNTLYDIEDSKGKSQDNVYDRIGTLMKIFGQLIREGVYAKEYQALKESGKLAAHAQEPRDLRIIGTEAMRIFIEAYLLAGNTTGDERREISTNAGFWGCVMAGGLVGNMICSSHPYLALSAVGMGVVNFYVNIYKRDVSLSNKPFLMPFFVKMYQRKKSAEFMKHRVFDQMHSNLHYGWLYDEKLRTLKPVGSPFDSYLGYTRGNNAANLATTLKFLEDTFGYPGSESFCGESLR